MLIPRLVPEERAKEQPYSISGQKKGMRNKERVREPEIENSEKTLNRVTLVLIFQDPKAGLPPSNIPYVDGRLHN